MPDDEYEDPELAALEAMAEEQHRRRFGGGQRPGAEPFERDIGQQNDLPMSPEQAEWERQEARRARR